MARASALKSIDRQRDLLVQVHRSLKVATQVEKVVKKAYVMLDFIDWWVVGAWNSLPVEVAEADAIYYFKGRLEKYTNRMGTEGYGPRKGKGY